RVQRPDAHVGRALLGAAAVRQLTHRSGASAPTKETQMTTSTAPQRRRGSFAKVEARQALGFASPALVGLALFTIVPVVLSVVMSFFDWPTFGERTFNGGANYLRLFDDPNFLPSLRNTLVFTVLYVPISIALSLALALGLGPRI